MHTHTHTHTNTHVHIPMLAPAQTCIQTIRYLPPWSSPEGQMVRPLQAKHAHRLQARAKWAKHLPQVSTGPVGPEFPASSWKREEMESQIESHLITCSLGLQLSRGWRVCGLCHLCGRPSWTVVNWNLIYLSPCLAHNQWNSRLGFILPSETGKKKGTGKSSIFHFFFFTSSPAHVSSPVMQSTELLICLRAVNTLHHCRCSSMVRADHRAQFDANSVYWARPWLANTEVDARWGYRRWRCIHTKSCLTVQRPSGCSTFHFTLLIFHILAPAALWPNASAQVAGIWMRVHVYPFTCMSGGGSSKQYASPPPSAPSPPLTSPGPERACYREEEGSKVEENRQKNPTNRSPGITNAQQLCGDGAVFLFVLIFGVEIQWVDWGCGPNWWWKVAK